MPEYLIYAAREEEYNAGYVWLDTPNLPSRTPIRLRIPGTKWKTFCESRHLEENFVDAYDARQRTKKIKNEETQIISKDVLVISEWYRDALGGFQTSARRDGKRTPIDVRKLRIPGLRKMRIAAHHPDFAVRIGLALALLGTWLGIVGIAAWVLDKRVPLSQFICGHFPTVILFASRYLPESTELRSIIYLFIVGVLSGLICWWPYRGPRRPRTVPGHQPPTGSGRGRA